jgi:hypothetical protein
VCFEKPILRIPSGQYRCHYVKAKMRVHRYLDGALSIFHGPRKLVCYTPEGRLIEALQQVD